MKIINLITCLFLGLGQLTAQQDSIPSNLEKYEQSLEFWEQLKVEHKNSYQFTIADIPLEASVSSFTIITVRNGEIIKRSYKEVLRRRGGEELSWKLEKWTERGKNIGKHGKKRELVTLDDIYAYAKDLISVPIEELERNGGTYPERKVYFYAENKRVLSTVGSRPTNCVDDCFSGYRIQGLKWLR